jgi:hypothetical protein
MSSEDEMSFLCQCGDKFMTLTELQEHIKERRDANDWKTHGQKE